MVLMLKRFLMDDVPVKLFPEGTTMNEAVAFARKALPAMPDCAGEQDMKIAQADIGSELVSLLLVKFDATGKPVESKIVEQE